MTRQRVNPHDQGTPERSLYDNWRKANARAVQLQKAADSYRVDAEAERAKADRYAIALDALGVPPPGYKPQRMLPGPTK